MELLKHASFCKEPSSICPGLLACTECTVRHQERQLAGPCSGGANEAGPETPADSWHRDCYMLYELCPRREPPAPPPLVAPLPPAGPPQWCTQIDHVDPCWYERFTFVVAVVNHFFLSGEEAAVAAPGAERHASASQGGIESAGGFKFRCFSRGPGP